MSTTPRIPASKIKQYFERIDKFDRGSNTLINEARLDKRYAVQSTNLIQDQDGIWKTRPGTANYGNEISGVTTIDGAYEYVKSDGTREIIAIGDGTVYKSSNDGSNWSSVSGATFTAGITPYFLQIRNRLYVANGTDSLAYYDGTDMQTFTGLTTPTAPTPTRGAGLSAGSNNNYYRIVATNEAGFTLPSPSGSVTTDVSRYLWDPDTTDMHVDLSWSSVSGAVGYDVFWGQVDGVEYYIGSTADTVFRDRGQEINPVNLYVEAPDDDTTSAPKFRSMEVSGNRMWATYDSDNPYRVYWSGTDSDVGSFSYFAGGGYIDLERGGRNTPVAVTHYRDGKGTPRITVLASSPDGLGAVYQVELVSLSVGSETLIVPSGEKIVGSIGGSSPKGVVKAGDNVFFINKKGIFALRNKEQIFNVLTTDDLSAPIRDRITALNQSQITDFVSYYRPPRVYFSVSEGSSNDRVIVYDLERNNWNYAWTFGIKQFFEYTDTGGTTRFLAVENDSNRLVEISDNYVGDKGEKFLQVYLSPLLAVDKDYATVAKLKEVIYELGNLRGTVSLSLLGITRNGQVTNLGTRTVSATTGTTGFGDDAFSDIQFSDTSNTPETYAETTTKIKLRPTSKKLYAIQFKVQANNVDATFELLGLQAKGFLLPSRAPSDWDS